MKAWAMGNGHRSNGFLKICLNMGDGDMMYCNLQMQMHRDPSIIMVDVRLRCVCNFVICNINHILIKISCCIVRIKGCG